MTDERFKKAPQAEILLQVQKDQEILGALTSKFVKGLELFFSPHQIINNLTAVGFATKLVYYGFTNYRDIQTLGEEYVYIRQFSDTEHVFLSATRKLGFLLLKTFGPYLLNRFVPFKNF
jgi:hypothetical protein